MPATAGASIIVAAGAGKIYREGVGMDKIYVHEFRAGSDKIRYAFENFSYGSEISNLW